MRVAWNIAWRFLKSNKGQTILIIIGIMIGVSVQIFIGSLIDGLQKSLVDKTIGSSSHISIFPEKDKQYFYSDLRLIKGLEANEDLKVVSKTLDSPATIIYDEEAYPILLRGVEFKNANRIYSFDERLIEGKLPRTRNEVILGKDLVEELGIKVRQRLNMVTPDGQIFEIMVTGIFDLKVAGLNKSWVMADLRNSERILNKDRELTSIETQVVDVFAADTVARDIEKKLKMVVDTKNLQVQNWKAQNEQLLSGLTGQSASSYLIQVFVLLAVLLGIASVLAISVVQKSRQIGILKAMGIKNRTASLIFLFQGLILGLVGGILGTGLGIALTYVFSNFIKNPDGTPLVPFYLDYTFITVSVIVAVVSSTLASLIPARKSSKLNPIEVIKNG